jgi:hypothetical protein
VKIFTDKEVSLTPDKILIVAAVDPENKTLSKTLEDWNESKEVEEYIINEQCITKTCRESNILIYKGALHFVYVSGITDNLVSSLLRTSDVPYDDFYKRILNSDATLKHLEPTTLIGFLNNAWEHTHKLSNSIVTKLVRLIIENKKFNQDMAHIITEMIISESMVKEAVELFVGNKKFVQHLSLDDLCKIMLHVSKLPNVSPDVIVDEVSKRFSKATETEKEIIDDSIIEMENHVFIAKLMRAGVISQLIVSKLIQEVLKSLNKKDADIICEIIIKIVLDGMLTDDHIGSFKDFSEASQRLVYVASRSSVDGDLMTKLRAKKAGDCTVVTVIQTAVLQGKTKQVKFDLFSKVVKIIKIVAAKFTGSKVLQKLNDEIRELVEYIVSRVDDDTKDMFSSILQGVDKSFEEYNSGNKSKADLIKELEEILAELKEVKEEIDASVDDDDATASSTSDADISMMYTVLDIDEKDRGDYDILKKAYRKWALDNHPDKFQDEDEKKEANNKFILVSRIYETELKNIEETTKKAA